MSAQALRLAVASVLALAACSKEPVVTPTPRPPMERITADTLKELADAYNQRHARPQFILQGAACKQAMFAALNLASPEPLILALENAPEFVLHRIPEQHPERIVIRMRSDTARHRGNESDCPT